MRRSGTHAVRYGKMLALLLLFVAVTAATYQPVALAGLADRRDGSSVMTPIAGGYSPAKATATIHTGDGEPASTAAPSSAEDGLKPAGAGYSTSQIKRLRPLADGVRESTLPARPITAAGSINPEAIIPPEDERWLVSPTDYWPVRAVAQLEMYTDGSPTYGICTGTFIGPNAVLTAAHCLMDSETSAWPDSVVVVPGRNGSLEPYGYAFAADAVVSPGWASGDRSLGSDWGILAMPSSTLGDTVGWLTIGVVRDDTLASASFNPIMNGYPGDKPDGTQWAGSKPGFFYVGPSYLGYEMDTYGGQSGSAVRRSSDNLVVAVHHGGSVQSGNFGARINGTVLSNMDTGCKAIFCTFYYYVELPPTATFIPTLTSTRTPTPTASLTPTSTATRTPTATPTPSPTPLPTATPCPACPKSYLPLVTKP